MQRMRQCRTAIYNKRTLFDVDIYQEDLESLYRLPLSSGRGGCFSRSAGSNGDALWLRSNIIAYQIAKCRHQYEQLERVASSFDHQRFMESESIIIRQDKSDQNGMLSNASNDSDRRPVVRGGGAHRCPQSAFALPSVYYLDPSVAQCMFIFSGDPSAVEAPLRDMCRLVVLKRSSPSESIQPAAPNSSTSSSEHCNGPLPHEKINLLGQPEGFVGDEMNGRDVAEMMGRAVLPSTCPPCAPRVLLAHRTLFIPITDYAVQGGSSSHWSFALCQFLVYRKSIVHPFPHFEFDVMVDAVHCDSYHRYNYAKATVFITEVLLKGIFLAADGDASCSDDNNYEAGSPGTTQAQNDGDSASSCPGAPILLAMDCPFVVHNAEVFSSDDAALHQALGTPLPKTRKKIYLHVGNISASSAFQSTSSTNSQSGGSLSSAFLSVLRHDLSFPQQANSYDCGMFVVAAAQQTVMMMSAISSGRDGGLELALTPNGLHDEVLAADEACSASKYTCVERAHHVSTTHSSTISSLSSPLRTGVSLPHLDHWLKWFHTRISASTEDMLRLRKELYDEISV